MQYLLRRFVRILAGLTALGAMSGSLGAQLTFSDQTVAAGLLPHLEANSTMGMMGGAVAGDFDRDGWQDLFVIGRNQRPDMLFMNDGDGTFTDRALAWGIAHKHRGSGAAVGDYDGDGWLDIYLTSMGIGAASAGQHRLYRNSGNGSFTNVATAAGVAFSSPVVPDGFGAAFGDYDLDGDLDLFVAGWQHLPAASEGNRLFRNEGNGRFVDATGAIDISLTNVYGFSPTFADMDGDRYPEILLAADFGTTKYLKNEGDGTFTNHTGHSGTGQVFSGMGSEVADLDNNGHLDWFITAIYEAPGTGSSSGNKLHFGRSGHDYTESAAASGVADGAWGWGTVAADLDLDGWLDLVETNGWGYTPFFGTPARLWHNEGDRTFTEIAAQANLDYTFNGLGVVHLDYDSDGDQDILFTTGYPGTMRLFRNDQTTGHHWLRLFLDTSGTPGLAPNGFGARVTARIGATTQVRVITGGSNYLTVSELSAAFGLRGATAVDELVVEWSNGAVTQLFGVPADQTLTLASP